MVDAEHDAAINSAVRFQGFQWNVLDELQRNGPEWFGDNLEMGIFWKVVNALVDG